MKNFKNLLNYILILFIKLIQKCPDRYLKKIINSCAYIVWHLDFFRKKVVLKNLEIAFPNLTKSERVDIAKGTYKKFLTYFADMIKNIDITKEELTNKVTIVGKNYLEDALKSKKPIIFMTAHFGNWEFVPKVIGANYIPLVVLMREFENNEIAAIFAKNRNSFNIETINKDNATKDIIKAIKDNKAIAILIDQHSSSPKSIEVNFFNKRVKFNRGISVLAKKFNALIVPMFSYQINNQYILEFLEPKEFSNNDTIESFTQWQASIIEDMIKKYPSEYYWFHKRFKNIKGIYN